MRGEFVDVLVGKEEGVALLEGKLVEDAEGEEDPTAPPPPPLLLSVDVREGVGEAVMDTLEMGVEVVDTEPEGVACWVAEADGERDSVAQLEGVLVKDEEGVWEVEGGFVVEGKWGEGEVVPWPPSPPPCVVMEGVVEGVVDWV